VRPASSCYPPPESSPTVWNGLYAVSHTPTPFHSESTPHSLPLFSSLNPHCISHKPNPIFMSSKRSSIAQTVQQRGRHEECVTPAMFLGHGHIVYLARCRTRLSRLYGASIGAITRQCAGHRLSLNLDVGRCTGVYLTITLLPWLARGPAHIWRYVINRATSVYSVVGLYASLYSYSFTDFSVSHLCLGTNYDACCGTSRSVPLLRPVKMEKKGLEESFVTLVTTCHPFLSSFLASCEKIHTL